MQIKVNIDTTEIQAAFDRLAKLLKDTTPLMRDLAQVMGAADDRAFETETDPVTGAKWPKLNPHYKARMDRLGFTGPKLQRRGTLKSSIRLAAEHGRAVIGTNLRYAAIHQFGGITRAHWISAKNAKAICFYKNGRKIFRRRVHHPGSEIPRRRFLGIGKADMRDMEDIILEHLAGALKKRP